MKLFELLGEKSGRFSEVLINGVTNNSAAVGEGFAFVCIKGVSKDGHDFAADAVKKGAAVVIVSKDLGLENQIIVQDTRKTYALMCAKWFGEPAKKLKMLGVTGTNGKTSVSYMLKAILEKAGHKAGLIGTIQNMIGDEIISAKNTTPDAYSLHEMLSQMVAAGCDYCVMEVSSHALDQDRVYGVEYEIAMFTNLTQDHLDYHKTMENYCRAKRRLFEQCRVAVVNFDDKHMHELTEGLDCRIVTYSAESDESTYTAKEITYRPDGIMYHFVGYNLINRIKMSTGGKFSVYNSMCAISAAAELGIPLSVSAEAIASIKGVKGRAEVVPTGRDFTVIIDYAHTPDGLQNILQTFKEFEKTRLIAVFGCGGDRDKTKRPKMGKIAAQIADYVIVTSDNPRTEDPVAIIDDILEGMKDCKTPYEVIPDRITAINFAIQNAKKDDIIVLAGKGHETYQILKDRTIHLDEREVVADALASLK